VGTIRDKISHTTSIPVHPHGRGDNRYRVVNTFDDAGSPPRAWGQSRHQRATGCGCRFTPTGVGTMASAATDTTPATVHPHGRGDNGVARERDPVAGGSPPRAWGQSPHRATPRPQSRFTPTGVGTIRWNSTSPSARTVHPHGRGDNLTAAAQWIWANGSPPRAWGQCRLNRPDRRQPRFTPTGVGTIWSRRRSGFGRTVHPHGRGDNALVDAKRGDDPDGSPPRAWGQCSTT